MDSLNFTIDGDLGLPGFVRVPPPFGTPRHAVRAIHATLARVENVAQLAAAATTAHRVSRTQWHRRLTVVAIGVACTVAAALIGTHTGKRQQPLPHIDPMQYAAVAQAPVPSAPQDALAADTAPSVAANTAADKVEAAPVKTEAVPSVEAQPDISVAAKPKAEAAPAPVLSKLPDTATKPRTLARATGRTAGPVAPARPAVTTYDEPVTIESYRALDDTAPVTSDYVAPGTSVRIELQRHTRLTD